MADQTQMAEKSMAVSLMLDELGWLNIEKVIKKSPFLRKKLTLGGFQISIKKADKLKQRLSNEIKKDTNLLKPFFFMWYSNQKFFEITQKYFESEKYKEWSKDLSIPNGKYRIPEENLCEMTDSWNYSQSRIMLFCSPIEFDEETTKNILELKNSHENESTADIETFELTNPITDDQRDLNKTIRGLENEIRQLIKQKDSHLKEIKSHKSELAHWKKKFEETHNRAAKLKNEINLLKKQESSHQAEIKSHKSELVHLKLDNDNLNVMLERRRRDIIELEEKYQQTESQCHNLQGENTKLLSRFRQKEVELENMNAMLSYNPFNVPVDTVKLLYTIVRKIQNKNQDVETLIQNITIPQSQTDFDNNPAEKPSVFWSFLDNRERPLVNWLDKVDKRMTQTELDMKSSEIIDLILDAKYALYAKDAFLDVLHQLLKQN
ncbi:MAG: hypothetical protein HQM12_19290 [SAR324 cluster bacterium]|nr:hypothetical protein [SAR324 cluster bacterium]